MEFMIDRSLRNGAVPEEVRRMTGREFERMEKASEAST